MERVRRCLRRGDAVAGENAFSASSSRNQQNLSQPMKTAKIQKPRESLTSKFVRAACYPLFVIALVASPSLNAAITGQWDFKSGNLAATTGAALQYFDGVGGETSQQTVFGTTTTLGLPDIGGQPAHVMGFPRALPTMGYVVTPGAAANGGGSFVNQYTLIFDLLFPPASSGGWRGLIQIDDPVNNANDADLHINPAGAIGISGSYQGQVQTNTWHRIAFAFDLAAPGGPLLRKYIDGALVGEQILGAGVDGRWALNPVGGAFGETALLFTDDNADGGNTQPGFVSSIQIHDEALSSGYIQALGAPTTDGIPTTVVVPVTIVSRKPLANAMNVTPGSGIEVILADGSSPLNTATIVVKVNDQTLSRTVNSAGGLHTVQATLPTLNARSMNTLAIELTDPGLGPVTLQWDFRMAAYVLDSELEEEFAHRIAAYWKLDDGLTNPTATVMVDYIGENHSTITAGLPDYWIGAPQARFGGALRVDGENVYATVLPSDSLNIGTNAVTVSLWVKLEQLPADIPGSFGAIYDSVGDEYVLYLDKANRELRFKVTLANGEAARPGIPEARLKLGEWMHIVGQYDGKASLTVGEARVYLNGELMDTHVGHDGAPGTGLTGNVRSGQTAGLGRNGPDPANYYTGGIDDIAVWSQALSVDAIGYLASGNFVPVQAPDPNQLSIVQHPESRTAIPGTRVTFEVVREGGTPPFSYQWKHAGTNLPGATSSRLFVLVTPEAAGQYSAVVQDAVTSLESNPATLTVVPLPAEPTASLPLGLVAHWPLDDGLSNPATSIIADVRGTNPGTLFGGGPSAWLAAPQALFGGALDVDGVNIYSVISNTPALDINENQVTISLWAKLDQLPSELPGSFGAIYDSVGDNYVVYLDRNNQELRFKVTTAEGQAARPGIPQADLVLNEWLHIVAVYDGNATPTAGEARIYLNGVLKDTHVGHDAAVGSGLTGLVLAGQIAGLGRNGPNAESYFTGAIDDIGIWNRALTSGEIAYLASSNPIPQSATPWVIYENDFESYTEVATSLGDESDADPTGIEWQMQDDIPIAGAGADGSGVQVVNWIAASGAKSLLVRPGSEARIHFRETRSGSKYQLDFRIYSDRGPTSSHNFYILLNGMGSDNNGGDFLAYRGGRLTNDLALVSYDGVRATPGWANVGTNHLTQAWQHHRIVFDPNVPSLSVYVDDMTTPLLVNSGTARSETPMPTMMRIVNEGNSADDGFFAIDDIKLTVEGSIDLTSTFTEGFEGYPASSAGGLIDADPLGAWITTETDGTAAGGGRPLAPARVQVVDSSVVTPRSGNNSLKLEGGQRAGVTLAWGTPPGTDVQITWWARVPASVPGTVATYLRMSLYGVEGTSAYSGDKALLGYGSRDASIGDATSLTYFTTAWVDSGVDYTPNVWEEYRLITHNSDGQYSIVKNPSSATPTVIVDRAPYVGNAPTWGPTFMAAWSSSNGSGHPPVYIDDIEITSFGLPSFSISGGSFVAEGFQLNWGSAGATATYEVWRGTNVANPASFEKIADNLAATTFTDPNPPAGGAYYRVVAK